MKNTKQALVVTTLHKGVARRVRSRQTVCDYGLPTTTMETHEYHELMQHITDIKERLKRLEAVGTCKHPTIEAVKLYAAKIGLPEDQAEWFFYYYQSNGWKVGRASMKSWESAMINWRRNFQSNGYGVGRVNGNNHTPSMYEMKTSLDVIKGQMKELADKYYNDSGAFPEWRSEPKRQDFIRLKRKMKEIEAKIAGAL